MNVYWQAGVAIAVLMAGFVSGCSYKQLELDRLRDGYEEQVQLALQENRNLERRMQADADAITVKYQKEQRDAEKTISDLRGRLADGSLRLSVRTESSSGVSTGSGAESSEGRADIDRGTAQALVAITERGDSAIRRLNLCIDRYEAVRGM